MQIVKGESFTFGILFNAEYDRSDIESITVSVGRKVYTPVWDVTMYKVEISSADSAMMAGNNDVILNLDDALWGVRKPKIGELLVLSSVSGFKNASNSEGYNAIINVTIDESTITSDIVLINAIRGPQGLPGIQGEKGDRGDVLDIDCGRADSIYTPSQHIVCGGAI